MTELNSQLTSSAPPVLGTNASINQHPVKNSEARGPTFQTYQEARRAARQRQQLATLDALGLLRKEQDGPRVSNGGKTITMASRKTYQEARRAARQRQVFATLDELGFIRKEQGGPRVSSDGKTITMANRKKNVRYLNQFLARPGDKHPSPFQEMYIAKWRGQSLDGKKFEEPLRAAARDAECRFLEKVSKDPRLVNSLICTGKENDCLSQELSDEEKNWVTQQRVKRAEAHAASIQDVSEDSWQIKKTWRRFRGWRHVNWTKFRCLARFLYSLEPEERNHVISKRLEKQHPKIYELFKESMAESDAQFRARTESQYPHLANVFDDASKESPALFRSSIQQHVSESGIKELSGFCTDALQQLKHCDQAMDNEHMPSVSLMNRTELYQKLEDLNRLKSYNNRLIERAKSLNDNGSNILVGVRIHDSLSTNDSQISHDSQSANDVKTVNGGQSFEREDSRASFRDDSSTIDIDSKSESDLDEPQPDEPRPTYLEEARGASVNIGSETVSNLDELQSTDLNQVRGAFVDIGSETGSDFDEPQPTDLNQARGAFVDISSETESVLDEPQPTDFNQVRGASVNIGSETESDLDEPQLTDLNQVRAAFVDELQARNQAIENLKQSIIDSLQDDSIARNLWTLNKQTAIRVIESQIRKLEPDDESSWSADSNHEQQVQHNGRQRVESLDNANEDRRRAVRRLETAIDQLEKEPPDKALFGDFEKNLEIRNDKKRFVREKKRQMRRYLSGLLADPAVRIGYERIEKKPPTRISSELWQTAESVALCRYYPRETVRQNLFANKQGLRMQYATETTPAVASETQVAASYKNDVLQGVTIGTPPRLTFARNEDGEITRAHAPGLMVHTVKDDQDRILSSTIAVEDLNWVQADIPEDPRFPNKVKWNEKKWNEEKWNEVLCLAYENYENHVRQAGGQIENGYRVLPGDEGHIESNMRMVHLDIRLSSHGDYTSELADGVHRVDVKRRDLRRPMLVNVNSISLVFATDDLKNPAREERNRKNMVKLLGDLDAHGELGGEIGNALQRSKDELAKQTRLEDLLSRNGTDPARLARVQRDIQRLTRNISQLDLQGVNVRRRFREGRHRTGNDQAYAMGVEVQSLMNMAARTAMEGGCPDTAFTSSHGGRGEQASYLRARHTAKTIQEDMGVSPGNPDGRAVMNEVLAHSGNDAVHMWRSGTPRTATKQPRRLDSRKGNFNKFYRHGVLV